MRQGQEDLTLALNESLKHAEQMGGVDVAAFHERKLRALEAFENDYEAGKEEGRYLPASLPHLPFTDNSFDVVISANLLVTYSSNATGGIADSDTLNLDFHRESVHELIRVSRGRCVSIRS